MRLNLLECTLVMMPLDSSKPFLIDIILKGNSVRFQGLEGTSLLKKQYRRNPMWQQGERESNCMKPTLRSHCSSHCSSHWCSHCSSHCRKPTVVKPYSLPVHMALAINGCPSPSSVLTSFLISLSNVHSCGIPSAVFPVQQLCCADQKTRETLFLGPHIMLLSWLLRRRINVSCSLSVSSFAQHKGHDKLH